MTVRRVDASSIEPLRERIRARAEAQIVRDSILPRGLAEAWVVSIGESVAAYAAVWVRHFPGRVFEFEVADGIAPGRVGELFAALVRASGATEVEWQTNLPEAARWDSFADESRIEHLLFEDGDDAPTALANARVRARTPSDDVGGGVPEGEWVVELDALPVAAGGILTHYNPPYGDLFFEVVPGARRRGVASFLVGQLRTIARESGLAPAARCDPGNEASRRTLLRGGMRRSGALLSGRIAPQYRDTGTRREEGR